jgi:hypothetical protein
MALIIKVLGNSSIGTSTSAQELLTAYSGGSPTYAVPTGKAVIIKNIRFANRDTVKRTVTINYLPGGSNARAVSPAGASIPAGGLLILDEELMLGAGDKLQAVLGETSGSNVIDFVLGGVERDQ